jgi:hypothetical protein
MRITLLAMIALPLAAAPAAAAPGFLTMDRQDEESRFGGELSYLILDDSIDATALRMELHGQYAMPSGFGVYGMFPISYLSGDGDSFTGVGNLEAGAFYLPRMASPSFKLAIKAGLTLPTAPDDEDAFANLAAIGARVNDLALVIPKGITLRIGASPMLRSGQFFGRLDAGLDINLDAAGENNVDPLIHLNVGGGIDFGSASLTGELVNVFSTDDDIADSSVSVIAIGVRGVVGSVRPYAGVSVPLDSDDFASDAAITVGVDGVLR